MSLGFDNKKRLLAVAKNAQATSADQDFWESRLSGMTANIQSVVLKILEDYPAEFQWFTAVQKRKEAALKIGDEASWTEIISDEKNKIATLLKGTAIKNN
jgi:hypothetical protein